MGFDSGTTNGGVAIAANASGLGAQVVVDRGGSVATVDSFVTGAPYEVPIETAQTVYFKANDNTTPVLILVTGGSF